MLNMPYSNTPIFPKSRVNLYIWSPLTAPDCLYILRMLTHVSEHVFIVPLMIIPSLFQSLCRTMVPGDLHFCMAFSGAGSSPSSEPVKWRLLIDVDAVISSFSFSRITAAFQLTSQLQICVKTHFGEVTSQFFEHLWNLMVLWICKAMTPGWLTLQWRGDF